MIKKIKDDIKEEIEKIKDKTKIEMIENIEEAKVLLEKINILKFDINQKEDIKELNKKFDIFFNKTEERLKKEIDQRIILLDKLDDIQNENKEEIEKVNTKMDSANNFVENLRKEVDSEFENIKKDIRILKRETDRNVSGIQSNNTAIVILYIITGILFIIAIMT